MTDEAKKRPGDSPQPDSTYVAHFEDDQDSDVHAVVVNSLRVVLVRDDNCWFAQGLELDYAASGRDLDDAKRRFQEGLSATINEHLRIYGTVENLLKVAPQDVWDLWLSAGTWYEFSAVSIHDLGDVVETDAVRFPFSRIEFMQPAPEGVAHAH